jgi:hypothetical protein
MRRAPVLGACLILAFSASLGCSKAPTLPTVPAEGVVKLDGAPLEGATVAFTPTTDSGKPANGITDAQGRFQLKTYLGGNFGQANGALPGDYIIMVSKYEAVSGSGPKLDADQQAKALEEAKRTGKPPAELQQNQPKLLTPAKYSNAKQSDLKATVKSSDNQFTFELTSS